MIADGSFNAGIPGSALHRVPRIHARHRPVGELAGSADCRAKHGAPEGRRAVTP
jgi:hypothetical protein